MGKLGKSISFVLTANADSLKRMGCAMKKAHERLQLFAEAIRALRKIPVLGAPRKER